MPSAQLHYCLRVNYNIWSKYLASANIPNGLSRRFSINRKRRKETRRNRLLHPNTLTKKYHIVIPHAQGICESIKNICGKHGVAAHFKGGQTLKDILVSPKDRDSMANRNSVIYSYSCGRIDCDEEYIGELGRTFGERFWEHLKAPSPICGHQNSSGHETSMENFQIIGRGENTLARTIKDAIYIRVNNSTLNRNIGKYNLPYILHWVLFTIPELKINK